MNLKWVFIFWVFILLENYVTQSSSITYDNKAIVINGQRRILISGSIHYPRSTPQMWEDLIVKAKQGGLDVVDTYVFWNAHEPSPGKYNFEGRYDLVRFMKAIQKAGLYAHLRIGPYVCAEWNYGWILLLYIVLINFIVGFPVWLKYVPGITFRTDNEPFKRAMQGFTKKIVDLMRSNNLFASQGGPIILSQIENEFGKQSKIQGQKGYNYVSWAANMAVGLHTGVPWVMCKENDAPDPIINTCNGFYCDTFVPNKHYKPLMWTEAWSGWFTEFGGPIYQRPVQDLAFAVAKFIQRGGSFINYYMYHGGTNFGRSAGGPFITTSYDYDAPLDEYGLPNQPKYDHLMELHRAIKLCEHALVSANPSVTSIGSNQQAYTYYPKKGKCTAFLSNYDKKSAAKVLFNDVHYSLPPLSISILPDCRNVAFNTAKVGAQTSHMAMLPSNTRIFSWNSYYEEIDTPNDRSTFSSMGLLDQINVTRDTSDYLWYKSSIRVNPSESFLRKGQQPTLVVDSTGHGIHVFVNGKLIGSAFGTRKHRRVSFTGKVNLHPGVNHIALLSIAVGLPNIGQHLEAMETGILGPVVLHGLDKGTWDLSRHRWTYQIGLKGERLNVAYPAGVSSVRWMGLQKERPLIWHKAYFNAPNGYEPIGLDMKSMGKGQVWINGQSIGRYWTNYAKGECQGCNYAVPFKPPNCQVGCGQPTQRWYHVPRSWLKPKVFEELGGDPTKISVAKRSVGTLCGQVSEYHPNVRSWIINGKTGVALKPKLRLQCAMGDYISAIRFASFGTPLGSCGSFQRGPCHAPYSSSVIAKVMLLLLLLIGFRMKQTDIVL
ncbi:hypothetical protein V2J09_017339 [Rumex salicifolius]